MQFRGLHGWAFFFCLKRRVSVVKAGDALICGHSLLPLSSNSWMEDSVLLSGGDADEGSAF